MIRLALFYTILIALLPPAVLLRLAHAPFPCRGNRILQPLSTDRKSPVSSSTRWLRTSHVSSLVKMVHDADSSANNEYTERTNTSDIKEGEALEVQQIATVAHSNQDRRSRLGTVWQRFSNLMRGNGWNGKLQISKATLSRLGWNALLSYGFVSNASYVTCMILAWIGHGKAYGLSPLAPGQWKGFLVIYSGFWAANNVLRPLRFSLSLAIAPAFDTFIASLRKRTGLKLTAVRLITVFLVNVLGTISYLLLGLFFATKFAGVPLLP